jgi:prophage regulatory protein
LVFLFIGEITLKVKRTKKPLLTELPSTGFLRISTVLNFIPVSEAGWWAGVKSGKYPKAIKIGPRITVWRAEDIKEFIENAG